MKALSHTKWGCKYHGIIPKGRRKTLLGQLRRHLGGCFLPGKFRPKKRLVKRLSELGYVVELKPSLHSLWLCRVVVARS